MEGPKKKKRCLSAAIFVCLLLATTAQRCQTQQPQPDADLKRVAKGLVVLAETIGEYQTAVESLHRDGLISTDEARPLMKLAVDLNLAGKEATLLVRRLDALSGKDRNDLIALLGPVTLSVAHAIDSDLIRIANPERRQQIKLALLAVQTSLNTVRLLIAGGDL